MTCVFSAEYDLFQIELSKNYSLTDWHDDLKKVMLKAGVEKKPVVFLFSDTQVSGAGETTISSRCCAYRAHLNAIDVLHDT